ncbi:MAG: putative transport protein [Marivirga sp.]|jgi:predicted transport protein
MDSALQTMINNMPEKTGKSLEEWKKIVKAKNFEKHGQAMKFLKEEHAVTHGFANTIIQLSKEERTSMEELVAGQYIGKEALLLIYRQLIETVLQFGEDVTLSPKKTTVSLIRSKQFALIKAATKKRIDLGLKLPNKGISDRLENSGPFGTMCTHRVQITEIQQIDNQLIGWLKEAYEQAE